MAGQKNQLLLVEHDDSCARKLLPPLRKSGWWVTRVSTADEAYRELKGDKFGAVMLDRWLPDGDGLDILSFVRDRWPSIPAIVLSAQDTAEDGVDVYEAGADSYLMTPYNEKEIHAHLRSIRQRFSRLPNSISVRGFELWKDTRTVLYKGRPIQLSPTEFSLLHCLVSHFPDPVSRKTLLKEVFNLDIEPGTNVVEVHIHRLRRKLEDKQVKPSLKTINGRGYVLSGESGLS